VCGRGGGSVVMFVPTESLRVFDNVLPKTELIRDSFDVSHSGLVNAR
jgi:hypothetical protein